jgi:hypothetical protein
MLIGVHMSNFLPNPYLDWGGREEEKGLMLHILLIPPIKMKLLSLSSII